MIIANIQHFSIGDGDGIRTTVFFKGCNLHCPWCHNPETIPFCKTVMHYEKDEICGKEMTDEEVFSEIIEDEDFYVESGGGVTFSGGEVMLQAKGVLTLAAMIKERGISLFVDTAGCVPYSSFELLNPFVDTYLFDYKTPDEDKYSKIIGGNKSIVKSNIERLLADEKKVRIRIPLIPDFNVDDETIDNIVDDLSPLGIKEVDLLPFHRMGSGKYKAMGLVYQYAKTPSITEEEMQRIKQRFSKYFKVTIEH